MIKALLFAIVVVFIFWASGAGPAGSRESWPRSTARRSRWKPIAAPTTNCSTRCGQSFGSNLNDELLKSLNIPTRALEELIDRVLLKQAAARSRWR